MNTVRQANISNEHPAMKTKTFLGILPLVGLLAFNAGAQVVDTVITNGLFEPHSVATDTNNNYYITDSANNRIVKYVQDTAVMSSLAGLKEVPGLTTGPVSRPVSLIRRELFMFRLVMVW